MKPDGEISENGVENPVRAVVPEHGLHVLHLFFHVDHTQWALMGDEEKREMKTSFTRLVQEIRSHEKTQLMLFSMLTPKADLGLMLLTPDLQDANAFEKRLARGLGDGVLNACYSYLSLTEESEYTTTPEQYSRTLEETRGIKEGTPEHTAAMDEFAKHMAGYRQHRLYPVLPDWPVMCFYNMSKRRLAGDNWYSLDFEARRKLMAGHAATGRKYKGRILQLITGSTGLDEAEWGVTLLAHNTTAIKEIVYEMRFDEVSARFGEFGDFYIGLQLPLNHLFQRLGL